MDVRALLEDAFGRIDELVPDVVDGLSEDDLARRPLDRGNPIGWLVWHLARIEDDHLAGATGAAQVWTDDGWVQRFDLGLPPHDTGYGHQDDDVAKVRVSAELLRDYHAAVAARRDEVLAGLDADALDRVVDDRWDPPVTLGVRLVSVVGDCLQHLGQAAYVRGLLDL